MLFNGELSGILSENFAVAKLETHNKGCDDAVLKLYKKTAIGGKEKMV